MVALLLPVAYYFIFTFLHNYSSEPLLSDTLITSYVAVVVLVGSNK